MKWIEKQWEWFKGFFEEKSNGLPSHKNLIGILMAIIFSISYLKKVALVEDIPDVPAGWQLIILGILGIRAVQSAVEIYAQKKNDSNKIKDGRN